MRLVHDAESDLGVSLVLGRNLAPKVGKLGVCRSTLADDLTVPAGI